MFQKKEGTRHMEPIWYGPIGYVTQEQSLHSPLKIGHFVIQEQSLHTFHLQLDMPYIYSSSYINDKQFKTRKLIVCYFGICRL